MFGISIKVVYVYISQLLGYEVREQFADDGCGTLGIARLCFGLEVDECDSKTICVPGSPFYEDILVRKTFPPKE